MFLIAGPLLDKAWWILENRHKAPLAQAIKIAEKEIQKNPNSFLAWRILTEAYLEMGDQQKSKKEKLAYYRKAIRVNPRYTLAWLDLAKTLYKQKRYCEAKKALLKVINCKNPLHPGDYFMDDLPEAKKLLKKVSKKCPE